MQHSRRGFFGPLFSDFRKRQAVGRYLKILPRHLYQDYGHRGPYTPEQIEASICRHRVSSDLFAAYAVVLFSDPELIKRLTRDTGESWDIDALRTELGGIYFGGDADFTMRDVARYASQHGGNVSEIGHNDHGGGGGHHGGDGGGGHH
jgi:hypothetical protein